MLSIKNTNTLSEAEFDTLYLRYYPSMLAYAKNFVQAEDAEEVVQDVMVWLWENRKKTIIKTTLQGYIFRSIRNKCLTLITQGEAKQRFHQRVYDKLEHLYEDGDFYEAEELSNKIDDAIKKLPESYRTAFEKNRFENKTYSEIALELGVSSKTIDYRITQSLRILRAELKDYLLSTG